MYWFPAKRYGWGWGLPTAWQGWAVIAAFLVLFAAGFLLFSLGPLLVYAGVLTSLLVAICWLKGEPPRWRWGGN